MSQYELTADSAGITARVSCVETVDQQANTSTLAITLEFKSSQWYGVTYWLEGAVGDAALDKTVHYTYLGALNKYYPVEQTFYVTVPHGSDGTGTAALTVNIRGATRSGSAGSGWRIQSAISVPLEPIVRCSTVAATDAYIGAVSMIAVSRKNNSYTHTLAYSFGSLSGYIAQDGSPSPEPVYFTDSSLGFTVPESFYYELTQAASGLCRLSCTTYDGAQVVGVAQECSFTVTAPQSQCAPVINAQVTDVNPQTLALTGDPSVMVRFCSQLEVQVAAQGLYGADIVEHTLGGTVYEPQSNLFGFYARDTRGYERRLELTVPMIPYVQLTANLSCTRGGSTATTATLTVRGSCYNGSFGLGENSLRLTARAAGQEYTLSPSFSGDVYTASCELEGLDYTMAHQITLEATDALSTVTAQIDLQQGVPVFDWGKRDFAFHVPITAPMINGVTNLGLTAWPVGGVMMTAEDVSPGQSLGGRWEKVESTGFPLFLWKRLRADNTLGTAMLGSLVLGQV